MNLRQRVLAAAAGLSILAGSGAARAAMEPKDVVLTLYAEENLTFSPARSQVYFARDLDAALKADAAHPGQVGAVDFDYRYGAQDLQVSGLQLIQEIDNDEARVVAVFKNFGKANSVDWALCRRPTGEWRIADASSNTGPQDWDLRQMLRLPAVVRC